MPIISIIHRSRGHLHNYKLICKLASIRLERIREQLQCSCSAVAVQLQCSRPLPESETFSRQNNNPIKGNKNKNENENEKSFVLFSTRCSSNKEEKATLQVQREKCPHQQLGHYPNVLIHLQLTKTN